MWLSSSLTKRECIKSRYLSLALSILPVHLQPSCLALSPGLLPWGPSVPAKLISQASFAHSFFVPEFTLFHFSGVPFPTLSFPSFKTLLRFEFLLGAFPGTHLQSTSSSLELLWHFLSSSLLAFIRCWGDSLVNSTNT